MTEKINPKIEYLGFWKSTGSECLLIEPLLGTDVDTKFYDEDDSTVGKSETGRGVHGQRVSMTEFRCQDPQIPSGLV